MIAGVGTDICDLRRIEAAYRRHGWAFAQRILHPEEWAVFLSRGGQDGKPRAITWLGTRFSGKEAISKALGLGLRPPFTWHNCAILNTELGQPFVQCYGDLDAYARARQLQFHVSLSDEREMVCSFVVASVIGT